jgi:pimeloyl-ACP methyl ester carboxylesterase
MIPIALQRNIALGGLALFGALAWRYHDEKRLALNALRTGSQVVETSAGAVEYAIRGAGAPLLVLHGAGGGYEQGLGVGALLDREALQTIAVSRPGYRRTPLTTGATLGEQARAIAALLDVLQVEHVVVAALSAGGLAALQFALDYPERCRGLILISAHGPALPQNRPAAFWIWLLKLLIRSDLLMWLMAKVGMGLLLRLQGTAHGAGDFDAILGGAFPISDWRAGVLNDFAQLLAPETGRMALAQIRAPTLLIHGTHDANVPHGVATDGVRHIPSGQLVTIDGGTHMLVATHARALRALVAQFLQRLDQNQ